jgi:hypothetical protein
MLRSGFWTWNAFVVIEKINLPRAPRKAFPVREDTMRANEIDRLVLPMADFAARKNFSVARHPA